MHSNHNLIFQSSPPLDPHMPTRPMNFTTSPLKSKLVSHAPITQSQIVRPIFQTSGQLYNSQQIPQISFTCSMHTLEKARRICSHMHCKKRVLLCEECMLEDPEHVKSHQTQIILIPEFLSKIEEVNRKKGASEQLNQL
jgi:hypothetical protein